MEVELGRVGGGAKLFESGFRRLAALEAPEDILRAGGAVADVDLLFHDGGGGIPDGIDDAAPVRVAAVPAGFHQGAVGHGAGGGIGILDGLGAGHAHGDDAMNTLAVAHNLFREFEADVAESGLKDFVGRRAGLEFRIAGQAVGEDENGVVRAHVAVHGDAVETVGDGFGQRGLEGLGVHVGVGGEKGQHGGMQAAVGQGGGARAGGAHARLDHPGALADAADADGAAAELEFDGDFLGLGVAGHDGLGGVRGVVAGGPEQAGGGGDAGADILHGHRHANAAGGAHEREAGGEVERFFRKRDHGAGIRHALTAGAGVGIAGIDDDELGLPALHAFHADLHRGGANLVGGEESGHGRGRLGDDQREIALRPLVGTLAGAEAFDVAKHAAGEKAPRGDDGMLDGGELDFAHVKLCGDNVRIAGTNFKSLRPQFPAAPCGRKRVRRRPADGRPQSAG